MYYAKLFAGMLLSVGLALPAAADTPIKVVPVQFKAGTTKTTLNGSIKGKNVIDYVLIAKAQQKISVSLKASPSVNFNILPEGQVDALFVGSLSGTQYSGTLPQDGKYTIRVYQMGNAASSGKLNKLTLAVEIVD